MTRSSAPIKALAVLPLLMAPNLAFLTLVPSIPNNTARRLPPRLHHQHHALAHRSDVLPSRARRAPQGPRLQDSPTKARRPASNDISQPQPQPLKVDLSPLGSSLFEGRWEVSMSNDIRVRHRLTVEIHDQGFSLVATRRSSAFSLRSHRSGRFLFQGLDEVARGQQASVVGQLIFHPEHFSLESVAGVSIPIPDPPSLAEGAGGRAKAVRLVVQDHNTMVIHFPKIKKFYVLTRRAGGEEDHPPSTPIYALVTTNALTWVVSKMLETVGHDLSHLVHPLTSTGTAGW